MLYFNHRLSLLCTGPAWPARGLFHVLCTPTCPASASILAGMGPPQCLGGRANTSTHAVSFRSCHLLV